MDDLNDGAPAPAAASVAPDPKIVKATDIYTVWRNAHMNEIPPAVFAKMEAASPVLIAAIAAAL